MSNEDFKGVYRKKILRNNSTRLRRWNEKSCFLLEALGLWGFICLPMNTISFIMWLQAPEFNHTDHPLSSIANESCRDENESKSETYSYNKLFPQNILLTSCIFMMVAVSAERCQAICHPLRERPPPIYYMIVVVVISISLNARKYFEFQRSVDGDYETTSIMEYPVYIMFSTIWQELVVTGIIPFLALIYFNAKIYIKIKESSVHEHYRYVGGHTRKSAMMEMNSQVTQINNQEEYSGRSDVRQINKISVMIEFDGEDSGNGECNEAEDKPIRSKSLIVRPSLFSALNPTPSPITNHPTHGQKKLRKRHEKSVLILVLIVFVFLACHSFRLGVQTFQTFHSSENTKDHYIYCTRRHKLHMPLVFIILNSFNNLFLIINSSVNFIIYCAVRKSFRKRFLQILKFPFTRC